MKVLLVHNFYKSNHLGGEDLMVHKELAWLRSNLGANRVFQYAVHNDRASLVSIVFNLLVPVWHASRIRKLVRTHRIDVVHLHNDFPLLTLWVFRALKKLNCVRIQTLHNYRHWCANGIFYRKGAGECRRCPASGSRLPSIRYACYRGSRLQSALVAFAYRIQDFFRLRAEVDRFFCLSEHQRRILLELGVPASQILLKPNAAFESTADSIENERNGLIFVGRIEEAKGILKVLDSIGPELRSELTVIGQSDDLDALKTRYPEVKFLGKKSNPETVQLIRQSRYLLHSSLCYETFGLTLIEAMSQGTPVIGFPIGTRTDFIQDGKNGFFMHPDSIEADLRRALEAPNELELRANAIETAAAYSEERIGKLQLKLYESVLKR